MPSEPKCDAMTGPKTNAASKPLRVVVVGGSLGGLLAGNVLHRAGCDVTVHERIGQELSERGAGLATHPEQYAAFERIGIPIDASFGVPIEERVTLGTDGRILARHHMSQIQATWGQCYRSLKKVFPPERYFAGSTFVRAEQDDNEVHAYFEDGSEITADLLVGADGVRSTVRSQFWPEAIPRYSGYIGWRGVVDEGRFSPASHDALFTRFIVCLPPDELMVGYPVASLEGDPSPGKRRFNLVWYRVASEDKLRRMMTDASGHYHEGGIPPHLIDPAFIAEMKRAAETSFPPPVAEVVRLVEAPFFQTIIELELEHMVKGRIVLLGDGAFIARPHAGMGVTKAVGDSTLLADVLQAHPDDLARALAIYDAERCRYGRYLVSHAHRQGLQVGTPILSEDERRIGALYRRPENVIRAISMPPSTPDHVSFDRDSLSAQHAD